MMAPEFRFRGRRNYLHSTTVLNWILAHTPATGRDMDFRFSAKTGHQVQIAGDTPAAGATVVGKYTDESVKFYVTESERLITAADAYDEDAICSRCRVTGSGIDVPADLAGFTVVEAVVAGYKRLMEELLPDRKGRFAFARLQWHAVPRGALRIEHRRTVSGQMYEGALVRDGIAAGRIIFGEWQ